VYLAGTRPDFVIAPVRVSVPAPPWGLPPLAPPGPVVPVDLAARFDHDGISTETYLGDGDFDGPGRTYPAAQRPQTGVGGGERTARAPLRADAGTAPRLTTPVPPSPRFRMKGPLTRNRSE